MCALRVTRYGSGARRSRGETRRAAGVAAGARAARWAYSPRGHVKFWKVHVCMLNKRPEGLYHTSAAYSSGPGSRPDRATGRKSVAATLDVPPTHGHVAIAGPLPRCPRQSGSRRRRAGASARRPPVDRVQQPHPQHTGPHRTRDREMRDQSQRPTRTSTRRGDASERALNFAFPRPSDNHTATMAAIRPATTRRQRPSRMCP